MNIERRKPTISSKEILPILLKSTKSKTVSRRESSSRLSLLPMTAKTMRSVTALILQDPRSKDVRLKEKNQLSIAMSIHSGIIFRQSIQQFLSFLRIIACYTFDGHKINSKVILSLLIVLDDLIEASFRP